MLLKIKPTQMMIIQSIIIIKAPTERWGKNLLRINAPKSLPPVDAPRLTFRPMPVPESIPPANAEIHISSVWI